ncbi:MAG: hypothetical protein JWM71_1178, partial [Solirubrobacteraceae bacterium]|nr:hypothetical protein [Solirubrobacteraceae bacterium]
DDGLEVPALTAALETRAAEERA